MKKTILLILIAAISLTSFSQKKTTTSAIISFDATTAIDDLPKAENKTVVAALDTKKGTVQFEAAIKNFAFSNPRIQGHFNNSTWMNSDEFPLSTFNGSTLTRNSSHAADCKHFIEMPHNPPMNTDLHQRRFAPPVRAGYRQR